MCKAPAWVIKAKAAGDHQNNDATNFFQRAHFNLEPLSTFMFSYWRNKHAFSTDGLDSLNKQSEWRKNKHHADFGHDPTLLSE